MFIRLFGQSRGGINDISGYGRAQLLAYLVKRMIILGCARLRWALNSLTVDVLPTRS